RPRMAALVPPHAQRIAGDRDLGVQARDDGAGAAPRGGPREAVPRRRAARPRRIVLRPRNAALAGSARLSTAPRKLLSGDSVGAHSVLPPRAHAVRPYRRKRRRIGGGQALLPVPFVSPARGTGMSDCPPLGP